MQPFPIMKVPVALSAVLLSTLLASCRGQEAPTGSAPFDFAAASAVIGSRTTRFTEAHITGDLEYLTDVFADDARIYAPGAGVTTGRASIAEINAQYVGYGISEFREVSTARYGGPDFIVDEGTYSLTYGPDHTPEVGHYINIWKRVDRDWKLYANMWTTQPAPSAPG